MFTRKNVVTAMAVLALAASAFAAQETAQRSTPSSKSTTAQSKQALASEAKAAAPAKPAVKEATGTVVSADATKLVISRMVKGKSEEMSFTLAPETQRSGNLESGARASIKYRIENGENVATWVKATPIAKAKHSRRKY